MSVGLRPPSHHKSGETFSPRLTRASHPDRRAAHVFDHGCRPVRAGTASVTGDPLATMEDLDRGNRDPHLDLLADQLVRHAVVMLGDLDVIVEADAAALPLGVFVGCGWQGSQRWPVELLEKRASARSGRLSIAGHGRAAPGSTARSTSCRPTLMLGSPNTTAHRNTHLSMSLKETGLVDRDAIPRGVSGSAAPVL